MTAIQNIEFQSRIFVTGTITTLTGMHIGGNSIEMGIGGADSIVVRDPITNHPYIPGSSLRGKMRSLLEKIRGEMNISLELSDKKTQQVNTVSELAGPLSQGAKIKSAGPSVDPESVSGKLFGVAADKQESESAALLIPQRLVVRDAFLINPETLLNAKNTDMPMTEVKTEVTIDRITSAAMPRQIERVPAGAKFEFQMILNLYGEDSPKDYTGLLFECMDLLQDDYLGGNGSRGYGRIMFDISSVKQKTADHYRSGDAGEDVKDIQIPESLKNNSAAL